MINVMDEYVSFNKKCFHQYLKLILEDEYNKNICEELIEAYMNVRYSNYYDESTVRFPMEKKIEKSLDAAVERLKYNMAPKYETAIIHSREFAPYLIELDQLYLLEAQKRATEKIYESYKSVYNKKNTNFIYELNSMLMLDTKRRKDFLAEFESPTFTLNYTKINPNEFQIDLNYNITFSELYSEIAIKKVAEKDNIQEDLAIITLLQLAAKMINDIACNDFDKKYYVPISKSFFEKKIKISRLFNIVDNIYFQDKMRIVVTFECLTTCRSVIREYMKKGFVFGLLLDDTFDYSTQNTEYLELFEKIFISPDKYYYKDMKNSGKIKDRIVNVVEVK